MKRFLLALALLPCAAHAQTKVPSNAQSQRGGSVPVTATANVDANGYMVPAGTIAAATSTPLSWSVTTTTTVGPFLPDLGRPIWLTKTTTDTASISVTATTTGNCTDGVSIVGANATYQYGQWSNVSIKGSENLGSETRSNAGWCVTITPATNGVTSSGSLAQ